MILEKIGLLGGTFNPVHYGHLQLAEAARTECGLDKIVFIPSAQPPHKYDLSVASFGHRLAMLKLACEGIDNFECDSIEATLSKPSYTIDTLHELHRRYGHDRRLYFIMGADAFLDILTWKSHQKILRSVHIILSRRKGYNSAQLTALLKNLGYNVNDGSWHGDAGNKDIFLLKEVPEDCSSSAIRAIIEKRESMRSYLPESVIEYIQKNKLYQAEKVDKR